VITHWDDLEARRRERGHIGADWTSLTGTGSVTVGVQRIRVDPGLWSTPLHLEGSEEEVFYVLSGAGTSVQWDGERTEAYEVGAGDCLVHLALEHAHTLQAGPGGLEVLAFGQRHYAANTLLPNAGVSWLGPTWVIAGAEEDHPWTREAAHGPPQVDGISPRPARVVNVEDVEGDERAGETVARRRRDLGKAAGSERTGIKLYETLRGKLATPPHCHSAEEEIFVVLDGEGELLLWDDGGEPASQSVRRGSVVARPAGSGVAHAFRAGDEGLAFLAYGTREPNDIAYYPRSNKLFFRGVNLAARLDRVDYWDGED
jgi:uncharacterized cupin superfamily protein